MLSILSNLKHVQNLNTVQIKQFGLMEKNEMGKTI